MFFKTIYFLSLLSVVSVLLSSNQADKEVPSNRPDQKVVLYKEVPTGLRNPKTMLIPITNVPSGDTNNYVSGSVSASQSAVQTLPASNPAAAA